MTVRQNVKRARHTPGASRQVWSGRRNWADAYSLGRLRIPHSWCHGIHGLVGDNQLVQCIALWRIIPEARVVAIGNVAGILRFEGCKCDCFHGRVAWHRELSGGVRSRPAAQGLAGTLPARAGIDAPEDQRPGAFTMPDPQPPLDGANQVIRICVRVSHLQTVEEQSFGHAGVGFEPGFQEIGDRVQRIRHGSLTGLRGLGLSFFWRFTNGFAQAVGASRTLWTCRGATGTNGAT